MRKLAKSRAEELFTASQKKDKQALKEKEKARQKEAERVARLSALRLAKEAADKEAADREAAANPKSGSDAGKESSPRLPQAHRHNS